MDPAYVSIGLFVFLIGFAFWLVLPARMRPSEAARRGLPSYKNPPPPPKPRKEVCIGCWGDGVVKDSPFDVNFEAVICEDCKKKAIEFNKWLKSENERLCKEIEEKRAELDKFINLFPTPPVIFNLPDQPE